MTDIQKPHSPIDAVVQTNTENDWPKDIGVQYTYQMTFACSHVDCSAANEGKTVFGQMQSVSARLGVGGTLDCSKFPRCNVKGHYDFEIRFRLLEKKVV